MSGQPSGLRGDLLEDRIRDGLTGCVAEQTAIALQVARALQTAHRSGSYHGAIRSGAIFLDEENRATFHRDLTSDVSLERADIRGFGLVLYELFTGVILEEDGFPDLEQMYKAGITPALIELTRRCITYAEQPHDMGHCVRDLEASLREMLGEPAPKDRVNAFLVAGAIIASAAAGALWFFAH